MSAIEAMCVWLVVLGLLGVVLSQVPTQEPPEKVAPVEKKIFYRIAFANDDIFYTDSYTIDPNTGMTTFTTTTGRIISGHAVYIEQCER